MIKTNSKITKCLIQAIGNLVIVCSLSSPVVAEKEATTTPQDSPVTPAKPFDPEQLKGIWVNQRGSTLDIAKLENNEFRGLFTTAVAATKTCIGAPVEVQGFINGNAVSFSLSMESCGSPVTISLAGYIDEQNRLDVMFLVQSSGKDQWNSRAINRDVYTKMNPSKQ
ncbi:avidin/streptavidin family protein [Endozoicomonadaceae bacterium StTr2]